MGDSASPEAGDYHVIACTACRVHVHGVQGRNAHYRSDHHRYNLKRKVLGMQPLSLDEFNRLNALKQAEDAAKEAALNSKRRAFYCHLCTKKFSSEKALKNHTASRRHKDAERARIARPMSEVSQTDDDSVMTTTEYEPEAGKVESESDEESENHPIPPNVCVFDGHLSDSPEMNAAYMADKFGFFLPFIENLVDLPGLLKYLGEKVGIGNICVECDRPFRSLSAVRQHMIDKQHCKMTDYDEVWIEEYAEFYDFTRENPNEEQDDDDEDDDEGWEEVGDDEVIEGEVIEVEDEPSGVVAVVQPNNMFAALSKIRPVDSAAPIVGTEEVSMAMNGKLLGHRSLQRYYKQKFAPGAQRDSRMISRVLSEYRLLGWKGQDNKPTKEVKAATRIQLARKRRFDLKVGTSNYYTRKSAIKPSMAVFNSGYRP